MRLQKLNSYHGLRLQSIDFKKIQEKVQYINKYIIDDGKRKKPFPKYT